MWQSLGEGVVIISERVNSEPVREGVVIQGRGDAVREGVAML